MHVPRAAAAWTDPALLRVHTQQGNQLSSVVIPDSVTRIEVGAFYNNPITSLTIGNASFMNQPISSSTIGTAFSMGEITELVILYGFTTIRDSAFSASRSVLLFPHARIYHCRLAKLSAQPANSHSHCFVEPSFHCVCVARGTL